MTANPAHDPQRRSQWDRRFPSVEDNMAAEIKRLVEENNTLRATLGMVRAVLQRTVENTDLTLRQPL